MKIFSGGAAMVAMKDGFEDEDYDYGDEFEDDPPLYPDGKLSSMSIAELEREHDRQCDRQGALGDADQIDEYAVGLTEARVRLVEGEIRRRRRGSAA